jgi:hypothetical protein
MRKVFLLTAVLLFVGACTMAGEGVVVQTDEVSVVMEANSTEEIFTPIFTPIASEVEWISPMLALNLHGENRASVFDGEFFDVPNNDFGRENRGRIVTEVPIEGEELIFAELTTDELLALGAVKLTANFAYDGDDEFNVRFRFRIDQFQGHSITSYGVSVANAALILWQDADGNWWNARRTGLGGEFTGGTNTPGWFTSAGAPYDVFTVDINRESAKDFASQDFYILFTEEVPFRRNDDGTHRDSSSGYVITYQAELPDADGHFHNFLLLSSSSVYIYVPETE